MGFMRNVELPISEPAKQLVDSRQVLRGMRLQTRLPPSPSSQFEKKTSADSLDWNSHLCADRATESARSMPSSKCVCRDDSRSGPAHAASMCLQAAPAPASKSAVRFATVDRTSWPPFAPNAGASIALPSVPSGVPPAHRSSLKESTNR